ncbi:MAG: DsbA family protein [Ilumatobacteraceae bacterium]
MTRSFGLTYDYRCPFARLVHDHVVEGLRAGADWNVTFLPFCLGQAHVEEGDVDIWHRPEEDSGLLALQLSISLRDQQPQSFLTFHQSMFNHRHIGGGSLKDHATLTRILSESGADAEAAFADVETGRPLHVIQEEHTKYVGSHQVWGTPTFIVDDKAVFVRLLDHARGNADVATTTITRILDDIDWPILNEFKHTSVPM